MVIFPAFEREKTIVELINMNRDDTFHPSHINLQEGTEQIVNASTSFSHGLYAYENYGVNHSSGVGEKPHLQTRTARPVNGFSDAAVNKNGWLGDEVGLSSNFSRMNIRDEGENNGRTKYIGINPDGFGSAECPVLGVQSNGPFEGYHSNINGHRGWQYASNGVPVGFNNDINSGFLGWRGGSYDFGDPVGHSVSNNRVNPLYSGPSFPRNLMSHALGFGQRKELGHSSELWENHLENSSVNGPYINNGFFFPKGYAMDVSGGMDAIEPQVFGSKVARNLKSPSYSNGSMTNGKFFMPQSLFSVQGYGDITGYVNGGGFVTQGNKPNHVFCNGCMGGISLSNGNISSINGINGKRVEENGFHLDSHTLKGEIQGNSGSLDYCSASISPKHSCKVDDFKGHIYFMAKDQNGCRLLQRVLEEGSSEGVNIIFNEVIQHIVELMMNPFGNYLIQKLLDKCSEDQRMKVLLKVTEEPGQLVKISSSAHGYVLQYFPGSLVFSS